MGSLDNLSAALHTNKLSHGDSQGTGLVVEGTVHTAAAKPPVLNTQAATGRELLLKGEGHMNTWEPTESSFPSCLHNNVVFLFPL